MKLQSKFHKKLQLIHPKWMGYYRILLYLTAAKNDELSSLIKMRFEMNKQPLLDILLIPQSEKELYTRLACGSRKKQVDI